MENDHWAYQLADNLAKKHHHKKIICASGISPSGPVHIGNLREAITTDFVYKSLIQTGVDAEFIFSWDDFDKLRKVPFGMPESLRPSIGKPYTSIEDPLGEYSSYAERFEKPFEAALSELGITPRFIRQTEMYRSGCYDEQIKLALSERSKIAAILARNMTQGMTEEQKTNYFPIVLYSRFTGKDNTRVVSYDGDSGLTYLCHDSGKKDTIDFTKERIVKLPWKIDWPMRWAFEGVDFEPGGPDHASPGGSYDVAKQIALEVFKKTPPDFQEYQFVRVKGENAKMSGSIGNVITPIELLRVYPPDLIRWIYAKVHPLSVLDVAFDQDVIRNYAEFDRLANNTVRSPIEEKLATLSGIPFSETAPQISFKTLLGLGEATDFNESAVFGLLNKMGMPFDPSTTAKRLERGNYWLSNHFTEGRSTLLDTFNSEYYHNLSPLEQSHIARLRELVSASSGSSLEEVEHAIYGIPKVDGMTEKEKKHAQKMFFTNVYALLFGKSSGPRLPTYIWGSSSKNRLETLLGSQ